MKRAIPQKVNLVSATVANSGVAPSQNKQPLPEVNRRAGTSAAVIGLALSVGAHCLLLPRQGDNAVAAEPVTSKTATDVAVLSPDATPPTTAPTGGVREHIVQEGQSLWQVAEVYGVNPASIAALNRISLDAVLKVGQVLHIPQVDGRLASLANDTVVSDSVSHYGSIQANSAAALTSDNNVANQKEIDNTLRLSQEKAVSTLKQAREGLKLSLQHLDRGKVKLPMSDSSASTPVVPQLLQPSDTPQTPQGQIQEAAKVIAYQVAPGDTLSTIARAYGISQEDLIRNNRIANPNFLLVGQSLKIASSIKPDVLSNSASAADRVSVSSSAAADHSDSVQPLPTLLPKAAPTTPQESAEFQPRVANISGSELIPVVGSDSLGTLNNVVTANAQVATTALAAVSPASQASSSSSDRYAYVENLRNQIIQMRQKYHRALAPTANVGTKVAAASLGIASLPRALSQSEKDVTLPTVTLQRSQPQVVATAPLGSEAYEPLMPASLAKIVSPTLPSIGPGENYLPRTPDQSTGYIWPAKGVFTSGYGWRWGRMHRGIDIAGPIGTPIVAAASGVVITAGWNSGGYGNMIDIRHADGTITRYAHNNRLLVRSGQTVEQGQQIAEMGSTGFSTGPHSHFEIHLPGQGAVNPMAYLSRSEA
ncbi:MAG: peptidoglycan DD-metalloendopeptidase family protein [Leptolyngbyaceae cyanobacterium]